MSSCCCFFNGVISTRTAIIHTFSCKSNFCIRETSINLHAVIYNNNTIEVLEGQFNEERSSNS